MKHSRIFVLTVLAASLLSYGMPVDSFAQEEGIELPLSVETDSPSYSQGSTVTISGKVKDLGTLLYDITLIIYGPNSNRVHFAQVTPNDDGTFETSVIADGKNWMQAGEYTINAQYGAQKMTHTFQHAGGEEATAPPPPPPPEPICPPGKILQEGTCVDEIIELDCPAGTHEVDGECVADTPPPPPPPTQVDCMPGQTRINGECVANEVECGPGTIKKDGVCVVDKQEEAGGGCLIATAAYGSELAPQVQLLREIRDNTLLSTESGTSFMSGFNDIYYSFSPSIADLERESPIFREGVKLFITPMLSTLSIMTLAEQGSESSVLGLGISVIALNLGMYIAAPAFIGLKIRNRLKLR